MKPSRDHPSAPPRRPPKWVSPWSFDDEWIEGLNAESPASPAQSDTPAAAPVKARPAAPIEIFERTSGARVDTASSPAAPREPAGPTAPEDILPAPEQEPPEDFEPLLEPIPAPPPARAKPAKPGGSPAKPAAVSSSSPGILGRLLTALMGISGLLLFGWIYLADVTPEPDDDLRLGQPVDIAPVIGAPERLTTFLNAVISVEREDLRSLPPWKWDAGVLKQVVQANGAAIDGLRDLLADYDWHPGHAAWNQEDLGVHTAWPHVITLLEARAALLSQSDEQAALTSVVDMARLARHLHHMRSWPSFMHRSQELHHAALQSAALLLRSTRLGSTQLEPFQTAFAGLEPGDESMERALGAFYLHEKKRLLGERSGEPLDAMPGGVLRAMPARLFFKTRETLGLFATGFRELRGRVQTVTSPLSAGSSRLPGIGHAPLQGLRPNGAGESYFARRWRLYHDLPEQQHLAQAGHRLVLTLCAIRRFAADHQRPPSGLGELRPAYLAADPTDPFSGRLLEYDPLNDMLFSAGANLLPEGGHLTQPPLSDPDEPTLEIGLKQPAAGVQQ